MLSPTLPVPAPAAPANTPARPAAAEAPGADSFAQRLQQARQQPPAPPRSQAGKNSEPASADGAPPPEHTDTAQAPAEATPAGEAEGERRDPKARDAGTALDQLLPGWNPTQAAADPLPQARGAGRELADIDGSSGRAIGAQAGARAASAGSARAPAAGDTQAASLADHAADRAADARFAAALQSAQATQPQETAAKAAAEPAAQPGTPHDAPLPLAASITSGAASTAAPASPAPAAAPLHAHLSAAPGTPEFAPALGVQVSILVREGVQEARLHLNPAEMGPIAVQISLDGSLAQVHFQAEAPATREALQAGLPELASALRDSGFTLSGGGVSDPRRDNTHEQGGNAATGLAGRRAGREADGAPGAEPAPARMTRRQGVVDLYA